IDLFLNQMNVTVFAWQAWHGYLIAEIAPAATRIVARPLQSYEQILASLPASAERFIFHVNLSYTEHFVVGRPEFLRELRSRGVVVLNAGLTDVRKRSLCQRCQASGLPWPFALPNGPEEEMLIVKTNLNSGGTNEILLSPEIRRALGIATDY